MRRPALLIVLAFACGLAAASPRPEDAPPKPPEDLRVDGRPWIDPKGTAIVGFGLLRVVPDAGRKATFDLRYEEKPGDYGAGSGNEFQLFVLPGGAFATKTNAYADEFLAFARSKASDDGDYTLKVSFEVDSETTVLVCYGPWTAPDSGRPAGDRPVFRIDVTAHDGAFEWAKSEMGELITTNWTNRPGVKRGGPCGKDPQWIEVRPMILYDGRMVTTPDEVDQLMRGRTVLANGGQGGGNAIEDPKVRERSQADDLEASTDRVAQLGRADRRVVMTRELAEKFRRVPIRWR